MKALLVFVGLFMLSAAVAQEQDESSPKGVIHGTVIGQDGEPVKGIGLDALAVAGRARCKATSYENE